MLRTLAALALSASTVLMAAGPAAAESKQRVLNVYN